MDDTQRRYGTALAVTALAFVVRLLLNPWLHMDSPFLVFTLAVTAAALWGGFRPGMLATALSMGLSSLFFLGPRFRTFDIGLSGSIELLLFLGIGTVISYLAYNLRMARYAVEFNEEYLTQILETTVSGILVLDRSGYITFANPAAASIFGLMPSHMIGRRLDDPGWGAANLDRTPFSFDPRGEGSKELRGYPITVQSSRDLPVLVNINSAILQDSDERPNGAVITLTPLKTEAS